MSQNVRMLLAISPLLIIMFVALIWVYFTEKRDNRLKKEWKTVAEGIYDYVVYGEYDYARRHQSGAMVHTYYTTRHVMKVTAVYFNDGRTCVLKGRYDMPYPKGTALRVSENGLGERKIEKVESQ